jgi:hypothetical protein
MISSLKFMWIIFNNSVDTSWKIKYASGSHSGVDED